MTGNGLRWFSYTGKDRYTMDAYTRRFQWRTKSHSEQSRRRAQGINYDRALTDYLDFGVPDTLDSWEQHCRYYHKDLETMDIPQLKRELERVKLVMALSEPVDEWFEERKEMVEAELRFRRYQRRARGESDREMQP